MDSNMTVRSLVILSVLFLAVVSCHAHNTFSFKGRSRYFPGKRSSTDGSAVENSASQRFDSINLDDFQKPDSQLTLREMLIELRDYCDFLLKLLDGVRPDLPQQRK